MHNLGHGHLGTLLGSAFVVDAGPIALWLPGLLCLLGLAESIWGSRHLIYVFVTGHVGSTLLVAIGLTAGVESGWTSAEIPAVIGAWVGVGVAAVAVGRDFTDVGHGLALLGVASWFGFLALAGTVEAMAAAAACGAAGAVVVGALTTTRRAHPNTTHDHCGATPRI